MFGGLGDDSIAGGGGTDELNGGLGDDVLSSDRDSSGDFSRGAGETLIGAEGEDTIILSNADQVSGGADADTFNYVYLDVTSDPVVITDFDKILTPSSCIKRSKPMVRAIQSCPQCHLKLMHPLVKH